MFCHVFCLCLFLPLLFHSVQGIVDLNLFFLLLVVFEPVLAFGLDRKK